MQQNFHRESVNYFWITIGSLLFCAGLNLFIVPVGLYNSGTGGKKRREGKKGNPAEILAETPISKGIPGSEKRKENSGGNSQSHTNHCV